MAKSSKKTGLSEERIAEIRRDARSGRNWAEEHGTPPACTCGAGQRLLEAAKALKGLHGKPTGMCDRHPGGSVWAPPLGLWDKIKKGETDG